MRWELMSIFIAALIGVLLSGASEARQEEKKPELQYFTAVPAGWRSEVIPFPLNFAPVLEYQGVEELMFAPGMFEPEKHDFFSYAFLWIIDGSELPDQAKLEDDLDRYYFGLQKAVYAEAQQPVVVDLTLVSSESDTAPSYKGAIHWIEPFKTKAQQTLKFTADFWHCPSSEQWGAYFVVVPQDADASVIKPLQELDFKRCR